MDERSEESQVRCDQCGALVASDAATCMQCGAALPAARDDIATGEPAAAVSAARVATASASTRTTANDQRRCMWCGEMSPASEDKCVSCGAVFPRPELDEAYLRAAEERLRAANDTLTMMQRQRTRRGLGRFFGR